MEAKELMIDDWVLIDKPDKYAGAKAQIKSLRFHQKDDGQYFDVFICDSLGIARREVFNEDLRPIPLTGEILEKNGFKLDKEDGWWWLTPKIGITFWEEGFFELDIENKQSSVDIHINYLHQLQHALRLCGIEKEIEL